MLISVAELAHNLEEYLGMLDREDVLVIHNGRVSARLTKADLSSNDTKDAE